MRQELTDIPYSKSAEVAEEGGVRNKGCNTNEDEERGSPGRNLDSAYAAGL